MRSKRVFIIGCFLLLGIVLLASCGLDISSDGGKIGFSSPEYRMIRYNWDYDEGQIPVKWSSEMFNEMPAHAHDLALLSAALCAATGDSGDDGIERSQDYYITKAYKKLGLETVLYNFPDDTEGFRHECTSDVWDEHCFAIGYKDMKINDEDSHIIIITLRGTQSFREKMGDFVASPNAEFYGYDVYNYWKDYSDKVLEELKGFVDEHEDLKTGKVKILVGGHSLGGGAANLVGAALDYDIAYQESLEGYVPAAPGSSAEELPELSKWRLPAAIQWTGPESKDDIIVFSFGGLNVFGKDIEDIAHESQKDYPGGAMFDNIHNLFTFKDTFGPKGEGAGLEYWATLGPSYKEGFKPAFGNITNLRKFGSTFTMRTDLDYKEIFVRGEKRYVNHNMPAYIKAIYDKEDNFTGVSDPMSGGNIIAISTTSIPSYNELNDFLIHFSRYHSAKKNGEWEREYNFKIASKGPIGIMSNLFGVYAGKGPCVDYSIYPGKKPEMIENDGSDPKKWTDNPNEAIYAKFNQRQVNWILMNIFNVPYEAERAMAKKGEEEFEFYAYESSYFDRNYFKPYGSIAGDTADATPKYHKVLIDNKGCYCIEYSFDGSDEIYYAVMELKKIDGKKYWSIYSNSENPPENLKGYFAGSESAGEIDFNECSKYVEGNLTKEEIEKIFEEAFFYDGESMTNEELTQEGWRRTNFIMALTAGSEETISYESYPELVKNFSYPAALSIEDANRYVSFFSDFKYKPNMPLKEYEDGIKELTDGTNVYFNVGPWRSSASYDADANITGLKIDGNKAYIFVNLKRYTVLDSDYSESYTINETANLDLIGTMIKTDSGKYRLDHISPAE